MKPMRARKIDVAKSPRIKRLKGAIQQDIKEAFYAGFKSGFAAGMILGGIITILVFVIWNLVQ